MRRMTAILGLVAAIQAMAILGLLDRQATLADRASAAEAKLREQKRAHVPAPETAPARFLGPPPSPEPAPPPPSPPDSPTSSVELVSPTANFVTGVDDFLQDVGVELPGTPVIGSEVIFYTVWTQTGSTAYFPRPLDPEKPSTQAFEKLDLTPGQKEAVRALMEAREQEIALAQRRFEAALQGVLGPEQRTRYELLQLHRGLDTRVFNLDERNPDRY